MKHRLSSRGFTLVELMIVIVIIALLTGIIMTSLTPGKAKARDGKRISDVGQIQLSLEQYFDRCGQYPPTLALTANAGCPVTTPAITLATYISKIPTPPLTTDSYDYLINSSYTDYILHVSLESGNPALQNSLLNSNLSTFVSTYSVTAPSWHCYDASSYPLQYCIGSK